MKRGCGVVVTWCGVVCCQCFTARVRDTWQFTSSSMHPGSRRVPTRPVVRGTSLEGGVVNSSQRRGLCEAVSRQGQTVSIPIPGPSHVVPQDGPPRMIAPEFPIALSDLI